MKLGPVRVKFLRWLNGKMSGFTARGAPCIRSDTQATSNEEDGQLPVQPEGKRHILSISASLLLAACSVCPLRGILDVPLGTPSSSFLELN